MMLIFAVLSSVLCFFFFFNDTATTEIYTLSLHDALPILRLSRPASSRTPSSILLSRGSILLPSATASRSEEHTSELQSPCNLVCRLLLEKKNKKQQLVVLGHVRGSTRDTYSRPRSLVSRA